MIIKKKTHKENQSIIRDFNNLSRYANHHTPHHSLHRRIRALHSRSSALSLLIALLAISIAILASFNIDLIRSTGYSILGIHSPGDAIITVDPNTEIGIVRQDFYGANTHGSWLGDGTKIDVNGDGVAETNSDLDWHRQAWLDSGMKMMRWDAGLQNLYLYDNWSDLDFETWSDPSTKYITSDSETGADGWKIASYNGGEGYVSQSTDAYSGQYSLNVTATQSDHLYIYRRANLKEGENYNFSILLKGNGTTSISIQRLDNYSNCGYKSIDINSDNWVLFSVNCNAIDVPEEGYRIVVDDINNQESILIDNINLKENNQDYEQFFLFNGNLSNAIDQLKWAKNNNLQVMLILSYMPKWLADENKDGCNITKLTDCPPYDYDLWGEIIIDYLNKLKKSNINSENLIIEVWNEPYTNFFLSNVNYDGWDKSVNYNLLYENTYNYIKDTYPELNIGGPSGKYNAPNIMSGFLSNFTNKIQFISTHPYLEKYESDINGINNKTQVLFNICNQYNSNCNYIINSEWNIGDENIKNKTSNYSRYGTNIALAYSDILNNWPENVSMILYQWSEQYKYSDSEHYPEYPQKWNMVSEPGLDNEFTPAYNVTKDFAHYHSGGNTVLSSTSDNAAVKSVVSVNESAILHVTLISTSAINVSTSIDLSATDVEYLKDLSNGNVLVGNNGIFTVGNLEQYDVKHYASISVEEVINDTTPPQVVILSPNSQLYLNNKIQIEVVANEPSNCTYTLNSGVTIKSMSSIDNLEFYANETLANAAYTLVVMCVDQSMNGNGSMVNFTVNTGADIIAPVITINSPTTKTYNDDNVSLSVTINELGICNSSFNDKSNKSMNTLDNRTFTKNELDLIDDDYVARFYCTDFSGNTAMARIHFTISTTTTPVVTPSSGGGGGGGGGGGEVTAQSNNDSISQVNDTNVSTDTSTENSNVVGYYEIPEEEITSTRDSSITPGTSLAGRAITNFDEAAGKTSTKIIIILIIGIIMITMAILVLKYFKHHKRHSYISSLKLKDWIHKAKEIGHDETTMENILVTHGWDRNVVKQALEESKGNNSITTNKE